MALMADAFELAEKYRTPVFILADGTLGQAMEPVELTFREPARLANDWALSGADGRPPRVVKSMHLEPENLEVHNQHLQAKFAEIAAQARGVLGVELSAGQRVEDVRLAIEGRRPVAFEGRTGGMVPTPGEVLDALRRLRGVAAGNAAPTKEARA